MPDTYRVPKRPADEQSHEPREYEAIAGSPHFSVVARTGDHAPIPTGLVSVDSGLCTTSDTGVVHRPNDHRDKLGGDYGDVRRRLSSATDSPKHWRRLLRRPLIGRAIVDGCAGVGTVLSWELHAFVRRPSGWLLLLAAALTGGWSFSWLVTLLVRGGGVSLRQVDDPIVGFLGPNLFLVSLGTLFVPLLTMNFVADERRRGTWELLLTSPISPGQALLGKFCAGWGLLLAALSPWLYYLLVLRLWNGKTRMLVGFVPWFDGLGVGFDLGPVVAGTVGLAMIGGTFVAIGLFCSSVCRRPLSAALLTFGALAAVLVLSFLPRLLLTWGFGREQLVWIDAFSCWGHLERFSRGTILPRVMIAHLSVWGTLLWLATHMGRQVDEAK